MQDFQIDANILKKSKYNIWYSRSSKLNCPSLKGNHAPRPKIERPNGKNTKSEFFLKISQELVRPAHSQCSGPDWKFCGISGVWCYLVQMHEPIRTQLTFEFLGSPQVWLELTKWQITVKNFFNFFEFFCPFLLTN